MKSLNRCWSGLLALVALTIVGCSQGSVSPAGQVPQDQQSSEGVPGGQTLTVGTPFLSRPPDPVKGGFNAVKFGLSETLFKLGRDLDPEPWLATGARKVDANTWEISLREGVRFHDGASMDAAAVKASLDRAVAESATARALLDIARVEALDATTISIATNSPSPILPALLAEPTTGIVNAAAAEAMGDEFDQRAVLTGPYKVERFRINQELVAVRHEDYWGERPPLDRVIFKVLADNSSRVLALQSGDIDVAEYLAPESVATVRQAPDLEVKSAPAVALEFMYLDHRKRPWQDSRVRRAIAHAIDREELAQAVLQGTGAAAHGPFSPVVLQCSQVQGHAFDPERARELLVQAGYRDVDSDGTVEKDGEALFMKLLTYPQRPELLPMAQVIQSRLTDIGMRVEIHSVEGINAALEQGDWDGGLYFNNMAVTGDPYRPLSVFFTTGGSANRGIYSNPQIDGLVQQIGQAASRGERERLGCEASQAIVDELPVIPLLHPDYNWAVSRDVTGFDEPHPLWLYFMDSNIGKR